MIDWTRVARLREEIGEDDFDEVVELFLEEVDDAIDALQNSADPDALEARLHFLKGSALNLGFDRFSSHCQHGEKLAARGCPERIDLGGIVESYARAKIVFLDQLEKHC